MVNSGMRDEKKRRKLGHYGPTLPGLGLRPLDLVFDWPSFPAVSCEQEFLGRIRFPIEDFKSRGLHKLGVGAAETKPSEASSDQGVLHGSVKEYFSPHPHILNTLDRF